LLDTVVHIDGAKGAKLYDAASLKEVATREIERTNAEQEAKEAKESLVVEERVRRIKDAVELQERLDDLGEAPAEEDVPATNINGAIDIGDFVPTVIPAVNKSAPSKPEVTVKAEAKAHEHRIVVRSIDSRATPSILLKSLTDAIQATPKAILATIKRAVSGKKAKFGFTYESDTALSKEDIGLLERAGVTVAQRKIPRLGYAITSTAPFSPTFLNTYGMRPFDVPAQLAIKAAFLGEVVEYNPIVIEKLDTSFVRIDRLSNGAFKVSHFAEDYALLDEATVSYEELLLDEASPLISDYVFPLSQKDSINYLAETRVEQKLYNKNKAVLELQDSLIDFAGTKRQYAARLKKLKKAKEALDAARLEAYTTSESILGLERRIAQITHAISLLDMEGKHDSPAWAKVQKKFDRLNGKLNQLEASLALAKYHQGLNQSFSKQESLTEEDALTLVERINEGRRRAGATTARVEVYDTASQFPESIKASEMFDPSVSAAYSDGVIYMARDRMPSALAVEEAMLHEMTHYGSNVLFGNSRTKAYNLLFQRMGGLKGLRKLADRLGVSQQFEDYVKDAPKKSEAIVREYLVDEFLALAQSTKKANQVLSGSFRNAIQAFNNWVRRMLSRLGFRNIQRLQDKDLAILLRNIRHAASRPYDFYYDQRSPFAIPMHTRMRMPNNPTILNPMTPSEARAIRHDVIETLSKKFGPAVQRMLDVGTLNIVTHWSEVPPDISQGQPGLMGAVSADGTAIYLVANNVTKEELPGVFMHDVGQHWGVQGIASDPQYAALANALAKKIDAGDPVALKALRQARHSAHKDTIEEETVAYYIQLTHDSRSSFIKKILAHAKVLAMKAGFTVENLNHQDLATLAVSSFRRRERLIRPPKHRIHSTLHSRTRRTTDLPNLTEWLGSTVLYDDI